MPTCRILIPSCKQFDGVRGLGQHGGTEPALHRAALLCPKHSNACLQISRGRHARKSPSAPSRGNISSSCCPCDAPGEALAELLCSERTLTGFSSCFSSLLRRGSEPVNALGPDPTMTHSVPDRHPSCVLQPEYTHSLLASGRAQWPGGHTKAKCVSLVP